MKNSLQAIFLLLVATTALCFVSVRGQEENIDPFVEQKQPSYNIDPFYQEIRQIARRYYPEVTTHRLENKIHFEYNTRVYIVHEATKTGEWQDPWEERGPQLGGIHGDIRILPRPYGGSAVVPQSFDKRYFTTYLTAPYSKKLDAHLYVLINYPRNVPDGFMKDMAQLLNNFDKYVTETQV